MLNRNSNRYILYPVSCVLLIIFCVLYSVSCFAAPPRNVYPETEIKRFQSLLDLQLNPGTAAGQLLYWDNTTLEWDISDETKLKWDPATDTFLIDTLTFSTGSITDSTGTIDFGNENLTTTGLGTFGNLDVDTLNLNGNIISDSTGTIGFDNENLTTTGDITGKDITATGNFDMPITTSTTGQFCQGGVSFLNSYGPNNDNIFLGPRSGNFTLTGNPGQNAGIGADTLSALTSGTKNLAFGANAGKRITTGGQNVLIGRSAGEFITTAGNNVMLGQNAGYRLATTPGSDFNVAVGSFALDAATGAKNIALGYAALGNLTTGENNISIGYVSGYAMTGNDRCVFLGTQAGRRNTASETLIIDNRDRSSAANERLACLIHGTFSATVADQSLRFNADVLIGNSTTNQYLNVYGKTRIGDATAPTDTFEVAGIKSSVVQTTILGVGATTFAITQNIIELTGDGGTNTIATITGASIGTEITIIFTDGNVTITDDNTHAADSVDLSAAFTSADDTVLGLVYNGTNWYEKSRSVN